MYEFPFHPEQRPASRKVVAAARSGLGLFLAALSMPAPSMHHFATRISCTKNARTQVWLTNLSLNGDAITGNPTHSGEVSKTSVSASIDDIVDWMYIRNARLTGGFSLIPFLESRAGKDINFERWFGIARPEDRVGPLYEFFDAIGDHLNELALKICREHQFQNKLCDVYVSTSGLYHVGCWEHLPMSYAIESDNDSLAIGLLAEGANPTLSGPRYHSALINAASGHRLDVLKAIVASGADVNVPSIWLRGTALHAGANSAAIVGCLLGAGANVNARTTDTARLPMHFVRTAEVGRLLHCSGTIVDAIDRDGKTALHVSVYNEYIDLCAYLIRQGYSTSIRCSEGKTVWDIAEEEGIASALRNALHE